LPVPRRHAKPITALTVVTDVGRNAWMMAEQAVRHSTPNGGACAGTDPLEATEPSGLHFRKGQKDNAGFSCSGPDIGDSVLYRRRHCSGKC
jgi:hypothetical protein